MSNPFSTNHYRLFRSLLGLYLLCHFVHLLPYVTELFSSKGMLSDASLSPLFGIIPNIFAISDAPLFVCAVVGTAIVASGLVLVGRCDRAGAIWVWYVLACLFARNPLIANPALPYLGWMLLAHGMLPKMDAGKIQSPDDEHADLRRSVFWAAWIVLALSYSYSGYTKLLSPSWFNGETVEIVLNNPLARDHFLNNVMLSLPSALLSLLTWFVLYVELLFAPLALFKRLRPWLWSAMLGVQFGFLLFLDFADLTIPMLLFHLLTFDSRWLAYQRIDKKEPHILHYDGDCGFCHGLPKFMLEEDKKGLFVYSPQQSDFSKNELTKAGIRLENDSIVLQVGNIVYVESDAIVEILARLGGFWQLVASLMRLVPRNLRNSAYRFVGRHRARYRPAPLALCPILPSEYGQRFKL